MDEDNRKRQVEILAHKAKFVLLKVSGTENFIWEVKFCMQNIELDNLIFFCTSDMQTAYTSDQALKKEIFSIDIPNYESSSSKNFFVYFKNGITILEDYSFGQISSIENFVIRFLDDHPELNEENERLLKRKKGLFFKMLSIKKDRYMEKDLQKWSWGAFAFGGIYGFFNNYSWPLLISKFILSLFVIPGIFLLATAGVNEDNSSFGIICLPIFLLVQFLGGCNGRKISWLSKRWEGKEYFDMIQSRWDIAGKITTFIAIIAILVVILKNNITI
jgi:hypothetical protein